MKASIRELRTHTKEIMGEIARGNSVTVTYRGKDYAKIVPLKNRYKVQESNEAFGMWKDNKKTQSVEDFIDEIRGAREK